MPMIRNWTLPISAKHVTIDLAGPAGNGLVVQGAVERILSDVDPNLAEAYRKELAEKPADQKTYKTLIQVSRKYVDLKWRNLGVAL